MYFFMKIIIWVFLSVVFMACLGGIGQDVLKVFVIDIDIVEVIQEQFEVFLLLFDEVFGVEMDKWKNVLDYY